MLLGRYEKGSCAIPEEIVNKAKSLITPLKEEDIPTLIKNIRTTLGFSRAALAKMIGVSQTMVGNYESGKSVPREEVLEKIKGLLKETKEEETAQSTIEEEAQALTIEDVMPEPVVEEETAKPIDEKPAAPVVVYIQSLLGGTVTVDNILTRIPNGIDTVYIKPEENKAYWVKGEESGDIDLW